VIRSTGAGIAYEATIDRLSESEHEVTGLVFALAGYFIHGDRGKLLPKVDYIFTIAFEHLK
jgi:hypothetical protein